MGRGQVKAKFHYAILVADMSEAGRRPASDQDSVIEFWLRPAANWSATRFDLSRHVELGAVPLLGRGAGSPSNTMSPRLRPTSVISGMLIDAYSRLAAIDMGPKLGAVLIWERGSWVPT